MKMYIYTRGHYLMYSLIYRKISLFAIKSYLLIYSEKALILISLVIRRDHSIWIVLNFLLFYIWSQNRSRVFKDLFVWYLVMCTGYLVHVYVCTWLQMPLKAKDTNYLRCPIVGSFETVNEMWMLGTRVLYSISNKYSSKPSLPWSHEFNKNSIKIHDTEVGYNL